MSIRRKLLHWLYPTKSYWYVNAAHNRLCFYASGYKWFEIEACLVEGFILFQYIPGSKLEKTLGTFPTMSDAMQAAQDEFYAFLDRCILGISE